MLTGSVPPLATETPRIQMLVQQRLLAWLFHQKKISQEAFKYQCFAKKNTGIKTPSASPQNEGNGASLGQENLLQEAITSSLQAQQIKQTEK